MPAWIRSPPPCTTASRKRCALTSSSRRPRPGGVARPSPGWTRSATRPRWSARRGPVRPARVLGLNVPGTAVLLAAMDAPASAGWCWPPRWSCTARALRLRRARPGRPGPGTRPRGRRAIRAALPGTVRRRWALRRSARTRRWIRATPTPRARSGRSTWRPLGPADRRRRVALRYHNVYGPGMPRDTPYSGVAAIFRSRLEHGGRRGCSRTAASCATSCTSATWRGPTCWRCRPISGASPTTVLAPATTSPAGAAHHRGWVWRWLALRRPRAGGDREYRCSATSGTSSPPRGRRAGSRLPARTVTSGITSWPGLRCASPPWPDCRGVFGSQSGLAAARREPRRCHIVVALTMAIHIVVQPRAGSRCCCGRRRRPGLERTSATSGAWASRPAYQSATASPTAARRCSCERRGQSVPAGSPLSARCDTVRACELNATSCRFPCRPGERCLVNT